MCKRSGGQWKSAEVHTSSISVHSLQKGPVFSTRVFRCHHTKIKQKKSKIKRLDLLQSNAYLLSIPSRLNAKHLNAFSCGLPWSLAYYKGAGFLSLLVAALAPAHTVIQCCHRLLRSGDMRELLGQLGPLKVTHFYQHLRPRLLETGVVDTLAQLSASRQDSSQAESCSILLVIQPHV